MASVVDTSVKHFHSGMTGAPVLSGTAGSLVALLNACLITGFDVKSATSLTVAAGVATLSFAGVHSATVESVITVSGASIAALNGEQKVTAIASGQVKFATAAADSTATGTLSFKMSGAGWSSPFTSANVAAYRSLDPQSTGMILRVDDSAAQMCRVVGYETMSDINTGAGLFPTAVQMPGGGYWAKSGVASAAAVKWTLVSDTRGLMLSVAPYFTAATPGIVGAAGRWFGDVTGLRLSGDAYACVLNYSMFASASDAGGTLELGNHTQIAFPRSATGLGSAELNSCRPLTGSLTLVSGVDNTMGAYPQLDGSLLLSRRYFTAGVSSTAARAYLPGVYSVPLSGVFDFYKPLDIVPGTGPLAKRKLLALAASSNGMNSVSTASGTGISFIDITGPWRV